MQAMYGRNGEAPIAIVAAAQAAIWQGIRSGVFQVLSSDHAPYRFDETGKLAKGKNFYS